MGRDIQEAKSGLWLVRASYAGSHKTPALRDGSIPSLPFRRMRGTGNGSCRATACQSADRCQPDTAKRSFAVVRLDQGRDQGRGGANAGRHLKRMMALRHGHQRVAIE